jgi:hypothetical protein
MIDRPADSTIDRLVEEAFALAKCGTAQGGSPVAGAAGLTLFLPEPLVTITTL